MKVEAIKGWSDLISAWVTTLGLIGGGCFGLVEYASKNRSEEIKTALTFLDRYDQAPYLEAHEHVFDVWYSTAFIDRLQVEAGKGSNGDVRAFLLRSVEEGKLEADINRLIEFYDGLSAFLRHMVAVGFVRPAHAGIVIAETELGALLQRMANYRPHQPIFRMKADEL